MCKVKDYPGLLLKANEIVRLTKINPEMPGYEMLIKAIVIYKVEGKESLYEKVAAESSVIPSQHLFDKEEGDRHPVEQQLFESMKSIGVNYNDVMLFIEELADEMTY